ncbi:MAG: carboxypeptidase-like regulatory domain-containing protein [Candidatus Didemnitutus sp.]|nr:carboxypeptidase-like regulatory domain-containing protein [Candidatus Didemnitutus sp.]
MNRNRLVCFTLGLILTGASEAQVARDLTLRVTDEAGAVLNGARVQVVFHGVGRDDVREGETNERGEFSANTAMTLGTWIRVEKEGYYPAFWGNDNAANVPVGKATMSVVLPQMRNPTALHAARMHYAKLPAQNEWLGFDLEVADWVSPHGRGKVADVRFRFFNEFKGWTPSEKKLTSARLANPDKSETEMRFFYGKWSGVLELSFPNSKEGLIEKQENYWYYSELRLPHDAPENGYQAGLRYEANTYELRPGKRLVGYFLRTRVKLDARGEIVSANYAKIYDEILFDPRGTVSFWYYFNPTPNDRNLEFDPAKNLFPVDFPGANVSER